MNISLPRRFLSPISIILYKETLFPAHSLPFPPLSFRTFVYLYISLLYILYIQRGTYFPATFPALSLPFIILLIYRRGYTFPAPFLPLYIYPYKVNTFSTAHFLTLIVWGKVCGEKFLKTLLVQFYNTYISFQKLCIYSFIKLSLPAHFPPLRVGGLKPA